VCSETVTHELTNPHTIPSSAQTCTVMKADTEPRSPAGKRERSRKGKEKEKGERKKEECSEKLHYASETQILDVVADEGTKNDRSLPLECPSCSYP